MFPCFGCKRRGYNSGKQLSFWRRKWKNARCKGSHWWSQVSASRNDAVPSLRHVRFTWQGIQKCLFWLTHRDVFTGMPLWLLRHVKWLWKSLKIIHSPGTGFWCESLSCISKSAAFFSTLIMLVCKQWNQPPLLTPSPLYSGLVIAMLTSLLFIILLRYLAGIMVWVMIALVILVIGYGKFKMWKTCCCLCRSHLEIFHSFWGHLSESNSSKLCVRCGFPDQ